MLNYQSLGFYKATNWGYTYNIKSEGVFTYHTFDTSEIPSGLYKVRAYYIPEGRGAEVFGMEHTIYIN